ncbi:MAG: tRNA (N6-isopentenyl adenosine(37)-C2)-methylthiotransferase MiaB [Candidatus Staskawiczbacteria bacterium]|nr:tRNA (N6-isopentenyl adenosine(37)-C2)-methylthiotransferase MiaB [Candidatus Staskawiczbacteria bacterium]
MNKKYYIIVYGCQMNLSDSERISAVLENIKYKNTSNINEADLIVVTMCSVRQSAVDRVQGLADKLKKLKTTNYKLQTILTGCVLKRDRKKFLGYFDYVLDIKDIKKISEILNKKLAKYSDNYLDITPKHTSKFSASVPIMTGCNNFCAYCVVPYVREREISRSSKEIVSEVKKLVKNGYKEIWLLGQNVNSYKDHKTNFPALLKIINKIPGKFWIRFTSSHPKDFNQDVINALAEGGKITPYLNLPIQSGNTSVLKSMNRHYTVENYKNKIKELRKKIPDICLSTDIIVGFPGETKKQFENTAQLFRDIKYDMAYINKYSTRAGTAAAKLKDNVSIIEKKRREKVLNEILKQTALENNKKYLNKTVEVLVDSKKGNRLFGRTKEYKIIELNCNKNLIGKFVKVKVIEANPWKLKGKIK